MNLISCLERGLSTYFSIRFEPNDNFSALVDQANLYRSGIYIVWNVTGDIPSWLIDTQGVVYVGKSLCLQKRVKDTNHNVIRPLRYLNVGFTISFIFAEESEVSLLESNMIRSYQPPFNVTYNSPESVAPRNVYWLLPYISKTKGDLEKAAELFLEAYTCRKVDITPFLVEIKAYVRSSNLQKLLHYKNCGENLHHIKQLLRSATRKDPAVTPIGTFHCFEQYLDTYYCGEGSESGIHKTQAKKYLFLYENWDVVTLLGLDKPEACYRLNISVRIISWGKKKREEGVDLATLDHRLFWEEKPETKPSSSKQHTDAYYRYLIAQQEAEITSLRQENKELRRRLAELFS